MVINYQAISRPYFLNDHYQAINIQRNDGKKFCMRYEHYLMEQELGRRLKLNERIINNKLITLEEMAKLLELEKAKEALYKSLSGKYQ